MGKAKAKEAGLNQSHSVSAYAFECLQKFVDRHVAKGHEVPMFLDPCGNCYAIFCATCDPQMGEAMESRHLATEE